MATDDLTAAVTATSDASAAMAADICSQISSIFTKNPKTSPLSTIVSEISSANRVFLHGVGREGLMLRSLCMRLFHLSIPAHFIGDVTTPPITSSDLLLASAGPGEFPTVTAICHVAKAAGARVALITANPGAVECADVVVWLPARTMKDGEGGEGGSGMVKLPMGSLYEGAMFVLFEMVVVRLMEVMGKTESEMRMMHTNLE